MSPSSPHHLIQGDGTFGMDSSNAFAKACTPPLSSVGLQYSAVAIMGPQSSGKSTLLNKVFGTSFVEMDAQVGRSQTTKGVWVSKSPRITDSNATVLVLDLEGSDGRERGEDDTNFEKQSALFALAVADVLLDRRDPRLQLELLLADPCLDVLKQLSSGPVTYVWYN